MSKKQRNQKSERARAVSSTNKLTLAGEEFRKALLEVAAAELGLIYDTACDSDSEGAARLLHEAMKAERAGLKPSVLDKIKDQTLEEIRSL